MDQQTKDYLTNKGVDKRFFAPINALKLNDTLLKSVTYSELAIVMPCGLARYVYNKINAPKTLSPEIKTFLTECEIDKKYHVNFERLRLKSVVMVHHVDSTHLIDTGTETWEAEIIVKMIKSKLDRNSQDNNSSQEESMEEEEDDSSQEESIEEEEDDSSQEESMEEDDEEDDEEEEEEAEDAQDSSCEHNTRPKKRQKKSSDCFQGFEKSKGLRIGTISHEKFTELHQKYDLRRQRHGVDKWKYRYKTNGVVKDVQCGLKKLLEIIWKLDQAEVAAPKIPAPAPVPYVIPKSQLVAVSEQEIQTPVLEIPGKGFQNPRNIINT